MKVFAHRGASEEAPEHTFAAYRQAIVDGADGLECDVRLTADGVLVCVHDRRIDRISNGSGVVSTLELAELRELDFGGWKDTWADFEDPEEPDRDRSEVLTLERLLELIADYARSGHRRVELLIETKHPTRYGGLVERRLVELLDRFGYAHPAPGTQPPVKVMSLAQISLRRLRQLAPDLPAVLLMARVPLRFRDGSLPAGVRVAGPSIAILQAHPRYAERVHDRGNQLYVWTVNRTRDIDLCAALDVDAIITDRPRRALDRLLRSRP